MELLQAEIVQIIPASGWVQFTHGDETWEKPLVGWALVENTYDRGEPDRHVEALVLTEDRYPMTLTEVLGDHDPKVRYTVAVGGARP